MRKKAIPVYIFLTLMVVVCAAYFAMQFGLIRLEPPAGGQGGQTESAVYRQPASSIAQEDLPDMYRYVPIDEPVPKPNVFAENYTATINGFRITVDDVYVAKDTQGLPYPSHLSERNGETVDENGTLTSAHSYLFMDITVENLQNFSDTFDVNTGHLEFYAGEEMIDTQASGEIATKNINNDVDIKSSYQYMMKAGEIAHYTRAHVFQDETLEQATDLYLIVIQSNPYTWSTDGETWAWDPAAVMIDLTPFWPGGGEEK